MKISPALVKPCENVTVTVMLHNTGDRAGSEVVQVGRFPFCAFAKHKTCAC